MPKMKIISQMKIMGNLSTLPHGKTMARRAFCLGLQAEPSLVQKTAMGICCYTMLSRRAFLKLEKCFRRGRSVNTITSACQTSPRFGTAQDSDPTISIPAQYNADACAKDRNDPTLSQRITRARKHKAHLLLW